MGILALAAYLHLQVIWVYILAFILLFKVEISLAQEYSLAEIEHCRDS